MHDKDIYWQMSASLNQSPQLFIVPTLILACHIPDAAFALAICDTSLITLILI